MEDLIVLVFQAIFEFVIEVICYVPFDWPRSGQSDRSPAATCVGLFLLGCGLSGISLLFFNHTFLSTPALRAANLALAPFASAFLSQAMARRSARRGSSIIPSHRFWQAFCFTGGLTIVRFVYAVRT